MTKNYTTTDKRNDLIFTDKQRITRVYANNVLVMVEKLNQSEEIFNNMSAQRINKEWAEMMNPEKFDTPSIETQTTMDELNRKVQAS